MKYKKIGKADIERLISICGRSTVIYDDPERLESYSHDEVTDPHYHHLPEVVVLPATSEEVQSIMQYANEQRIPVTPRGAGSGLSGGAIPSFGGILLSFERMNRIIEIDRDNMVVTVEPGVVTSDINEAVMKMGLFYAGYPMSLETCFIGGNVAENAGGGKAIKYGVTDRYVYGIEAVLPTGEIICVGGKRVKDVTGYNLLHLLVGSEGTLAVYTKFILKLMPLPKAQTDLLVLFRTTDEAVGAVPTIMIESGIVPTAIEYMDELCVQTTCRFLNEHLEYQDAGAMLLITVDGYTEEQVIADYDAIGDLCLDAGAIEVYVADNPTTSERVWRIRRNIAEAFKVYSPVQSLEDIVVPFAQIPDLMQDIERISRNYGVLIPCYGHAGDGNLHATPVKSPEMDIEDWNKKLPQILTDLYRSTIALGGTISGEHGIGSKRARFMHLALSESELSLMKRIKAAFDPNTILNPGKIWPADAVRSPDEDTK